MEGSSTIPIERNLFIEPLQCRWGLGFALQAGERFRVFGYLIGQELESNKPAELYILSLYTIPMPPSFSTTF
jgi:hypothetical protein